MNTLLAFPSRGRQNSCAWTTHFYNMFEKNIIAIVNSNLVRLQVKKPVSGLYKDVTIVNRKKFFSFNYNEWYWEDIPGCGYIDNLKKLYPDLSHIFIFKGYRSVADTLLQRDFQPIDMENMSKGFFAGLVWKYFKRKKAGQQFYRQNASRYLKIWLRYNDEFLKNIKKLPRDSYVLLNRQYINPDDARVSAYMLKNWNLSLKYFRFKQINNVPADINDPNGALLDKIISHEKNAFERSAY